MTRVLKEAPITLSLTFVVDILSGSLVDVLLIFSIRSAFSFCAHLSVEARPASSEKACVCDEQNGSYGPEAQAIKGSFAFNVMCILPSASGRFTNSAFGLCPENQL